MVATNSVAKRTGNVSAGTSVFAMVVLEKELAKVHPEIDMVMTPDGSAVAMVHCNNCTSDLNAWIDLFEEFTQAFGMKVDKMICSAPFTGKLWKGIRTAEACWHTIISPESILQALKRAVRCS